MAQENTDGILSADEIALIAQHLDFYRSLDNGSRVPATPAQRHFLAVCRCACTAETPHEVAYVKYRMQAAKQRSSTSEIRSEIGEFGEGVPLPGWFTDEGWKRMRGQYLSNSD